MKGVLIASTIASILIIDVAQADDEDMASGNHIASGCEALASNDSSPDMITHNKLYECAGAINATMQLLQLHGELCAPNNVTVQQSARVVSKYMENNAAKLNEPYVTLMSAAVLQAWPCKMKRK